MRLGANRQEDPHPAGACPSASGEHLRDPSPPEQHDLTVIDGAMWVTKLLLPTIAWSELFQAPRVALASTSARRYPNPQVRFEPENVPSKRRARAMDSLGET